MLAAAPEVPTNCGLPTPAPENPRGHFGRNPRSSSAVPSGAECCWNSCFPEKSLLSEKQAINNDLILLCLGDETTKIGERKKMKEDAADAHLLLQSQPSSLSDFCLSWAAKGIYLSPFWVTVALGTMPKASLHRRITLWKLQGGKFLFLSAGAGGSKWWQQCRSSPRPSMS